MIDPNSPPLSDAHFRALAALAVTLVGLLAYANTFDGEFVWDDASSVLLHENVKHPSKFFSLFTEDQHAFGRGQGNFYRPLLSVSFMADYAFAHEATTAAPEARVDTNLSPFIFHVSSTAWHIVAALMLMALMVRMGAARPLIMWVPLIFVVHPLHTEAVAYISGRADAMSAALMFGGLYFAVGWARTPKAGILSPILALAFFAGALMSKESAAIFPVLLLVCLLGCGQQDLGDVRPLAKRLAPLYGAVALLAVYVALRTTALDFSTPHGEVAAPLSQRGLESLQALALYLKLIFVPTNLHMERTLSGASTATAVAGAGALVFLLICTGYGLIRKRRHIALGFAWFVASWLPISGLFPLNAPMAEHWLYVPLAGFLWALLDLIWPRAPLHSSARARGLTLAIAVWACALIALTVDRNRDWHDNESLYTAILRENPDSTRVHFNLAITYEDLLNNPAGARRHYEEVLSINKKKKSQVAGASQSYIAEELESHLSLGNLYYDEGRYDTAAEHYGLLLNLEQSDNTTSLAVGASIGMGKCFLAIGDQNRALESFRQAIELEPTVRKGVQRLLAGGEFEL